MVGEGDVLTELTSAENVSPDTEEDVLLCALQEESVFTSLITLGGTLLLLLILCDLLGSQLSVHIDKFKYLGTDLIKLLKFDVT